MPATITCSPFSNAQNSERNTYPHIISQSRFHKTFLESYAGITTYYISLRYQVGEIGQQIQDMHHRIVEPSLQRHANKHF